MLCTHHQSSARARLRFQGARGGVSIVDVGGFLSVLGVASARPKAKFLFMLDLEPQHVSRNIMQHGNSMVT